MNRSELVSELRFLNTQIRRATVKDNNYLNMLQNRDNFLVFNGPQIIDEMSAMFTELLVLKTKCSKHHIKERYREA